MKIRLIVLLLFATVYPAYVHSQNTNCTCLQDLEFLDKLVRNTPSFKTNKSIYELAYLKSIILARAVDTMYECHVLLNTLLLSLNDNHCHILGLDKGSASQTKSKSDTLNRLKASTLFNAFPRPDINLDSLETELRGRPKVDIEGVYKGKGYMTLGVFKSKDEKSYNAIVLDSEIDIWAKGEVAYNLVPFGKEYMLCIGGSIASKRLIAYTERIRNGFFYFSGFKKDEDQTNYMSKTLSNETYYREEISSITTYIKVGSFNSWNPTLSKAETFYKGLKGLSKPNLIIDLRNNSGGGERNSQILYKIVKDYLKNHRTYVIVNHRTASNAEQFAYRLSKLANCQLVGARTNGTLTYEITDSSHDLPCGNFTAILTGKKHSKYAEYESKGIQPTVLSLDKDWIEQINDMISSNKN